MEDPILKEAKDTLNELKNSLNGLGQISNNIGKIDSYIANSSHIAGLAEKLIVNLHNTLESMKKEYVTQSGIVQATITQMKKEAEDIASKSEEQLRRFSYLLYASIGLSLINLILTIVK